MTEQDEQYIAELVASGETIAWNPDRETYRKIVSVSERKLKDPEEDEPGLCANFEGGEYVALYNCELKEFTQSRKLG